MISPNLRLAFNSIFAASLVLATRTPAAGQEWPHWRGPQANGISTDTGLLKEWPEGGPTVKWQVNSVGVGYSSISVKQGRIYTQGDLQGMEHVMCLDVKTGDTIWARQAEPLRAKLAERVASEIKRLDRNADGQIDEAEAIAGLGFEFNKYDTKIDGDPEEIAKARTQRLFALIDGDHDGQLSMTEAPRGMHRELPNIDRKDASADTSEVAAQRTNACLAALDSDGDEAIDRQESKGSILDRPFDRIDGSKRNGPKGDSRLSRDELTRYFAKSEPGKDGVIKASELQAYYVSRYPGGDGFLNAEELQGYFGGYRNGQGDGPRGTPSIDGDRVYTEGGNGDVTCMDAATGDTIWHVNLVADFGGGRPGWGYSESPLVVDNMLIVTPGGKQGTLLALDKMTGQRLWQSGEVTQGAHYSTPVLATIHGVPTIVQFARETVFGVTPDDGRLLWQYDGANNGTANCATPIVSDNCVFASSAYGTGGGLAEILRKGDAFEAEEVYFEKKMSNHHGGIIKVGDFLYGYGSSMICMDFKTGDIAWQDRAVGKGSLTVADGMLYLLSERHEVALAEATPEGYREHGRFEIEEHGRPSWAHPVVTGGVLYIRDQESLTAYDVSNN